MKVKVLQTIQPYLPGLFDDPAVPSSPKEFKKISSLPEIDASIVEIKQLIKNLVAENKTRATQISRFEIEKSVLEGYKFLEQAYRSRFKITSDELDNQYKNYYEELHNNLKRILFNSKTKKLNFA